MRPLVWASQSQVSNFRTGLGPRMLTLTALRVYSKRDLGAAWEMFD